MKSNRKALLALIGAIVAAVAVAYGTGSFDRLSDEDSPARLADASGETAGEAAEAAAQDAPAQEEAQPAEEPAESSETAQQPDAEAPDAENETAAVQVPGFDLLRVEPGGDMLIAGNAAPGSKIEVVHGADVLTTAEAGATGDFVAILDERLKPGDYQIVLRATGPDGTAATSTGTAIVSVPETPDGDVLALVEEPGKASRLISTSGGAEQESAEVADAGAAGEASETAPAEQPAAEGEATEPATQETAAETGEQEDRTQMAAATPDTEPQETGEAMAPEEEEAPAEMASAEPQAETSDETPQPAPAQSDVRVVIEAVEIEGSQVFVAGAATPGHVVRVYANAVLLGDARTSPQGRFLIETRRDLPQGDYIIRADVLAPNRADVIARAAVPFERGPGENIAAVAPAAGQGGNAPAQGQEEQVAEAAPQAESSEPAATAQNAGEGTGESGKGGRVTAEAAAEQEPAAASQTTETSAPPAAPGEEPQLPELETALAETPPDITAPALQPVDRSVIIRRGDTLWHISRRVYGQGIRYTTIYKANTDQIRNPDMIFPGQVFDVPEKSENGEPADMSKLEPQEG